MKDMENHTTNNWMLDEIAAAFKKHGFELTPSVTKLVNELAVQKMNYGRSVIAQLVTKGIKTYPKLNADLKRKIIEVGGHPTEIHKF